jgi:hypothetical protein
MIPGDLPEYINCWLTRIQVADWFWICPYIEEIINIEWIFHDDDLKAVNRIDTYFEIAVKQ